MKKVLYALLAVCVGVGTLTGCKSKMQVAKTTWGNLAVGEVDNVKGVVVTTFLFTDDKNVAILTSVDADQKNLVKPFVYARGTYKNTQTSNSEARVEINAVNINGEKVHYVGVWGKKGLMVVQSDDQAVRLFEKVNSVTIK